MEPSPGGTWGLSGGQPLVEGPHVAQKTRSCANWKWTQQVNQANHPALRGPHMNYEHLQPKGNHLWLSLAFAFGSFLILRRNNKFRLSLAILGISDLGLRRNCLGPTDQMPRWKNCNGTPESEAYSPRTKEIPYFQHGFSRPPPTQQIPRLLRLSRT